MAFVDFFTDLNPVFMVKSHYPSRNPFLTRCGLLLHLPSHRSTSVCDFHSTPTSCLSVLYRPPNSDDSHSHSLISPPLHPYIRQGTTLNHSFQLSLPRMCQFQFAGCQFHHANSLGVDTSLTSHSTSVKGFCYSMELTKSVNFSSRICQWQIFHTGFGYDQLPSHQCLVIFLCSIWFI